MILIDFNHFFNRFYSDFFPKFFTWELMYEKTLSKIPRSTRHRDSTKLSNLLQENTRSDKKRKRRRFYA
jgi:hypothetical protein